MRRLMMVGSLLLAGCCSVKGPFARRCEPPIDAPCLTRDEKERRARDQLPFPDASQAVGPRTFAEIPNR